jgi:hypothetical protein
MPIVAHLWSSGDRIIYREVTHGKVWTVRPVIVVQDTPVLLVLFIAKDTHWKVCAPLEGETDLLRCKANLRPWKLHDVVWDYGHTVLLTWPGVGHAVHVMWDRQQKFVGWYINIQEPLRRTHLGFNFLDQELDVVVSPDLKWRWKDTDHLKRAQAIGLFSAAQVSAIWEEAQRAIARIQSRAVPFDGSWNDWRPPPNWHPPRLPEGWDQVG